MFQLFDLYLVLTIFLSMFNELTLVDFSVVWKKIRRKYTSGLFGRLLGKMFPLFKLLNSLEEQLLQHNNLLCFYSSFWQRYVFVFTLAFISKQQLFSARLIFAVQLFELQKLYSFINSSTWHEAVFVRPQVVCIAAVVWLLLFLAPLHCLGGETAYSEYSFVFVFPDIEEHLKTLKLCLVLGRLWNA